MTVHLPSESKIEMSTANNSHAEILIVDDDALSRKILAQVLTSAGYDCEVCENGAEALKIIHAKPPSLLLLDFDMPGANGAEVLKQPSLGSTPGSRTGANHHVDRARKRGKRSLLFAGWRG